MAQVKHQKWIDFGIQGTQNDDGSFSLIIQPHREQLMVQYRCEIPAVDGAEATLTKLALDSDLARAAIPALVTGNAVPVDFSTQVDAEIIRIRKRDLRAQQAVASDRDRHLERPSDAVGRRNSSLGVTQ